MTQQEFFARYKYDRTTDRIGGGGFGNVFKAFDTIENETVALKIAEVKPGQESLSLQKEVELASSLDRHVNIVRYSACYRFDVPTGVYDFGILQYYPLGNLSQLVKSKKLKEAEKENIAQGIISGIHHLHSNNIVHRDLKSANILIAEGYKGEYVPKIADFGLSKQFTETDKSYFSNSFAGGSLLYVAPEQLEGKELRKNVDLWSLGVVLFELFTGETPFKATVDDGTETARAEIISKIKNASIPASISTIPVKWQEVIRNCLVSDPRHRIKSIEDVMTTIGTSSGKSSDTIIDPDPKPGPKPPISDPPRTRPIPTWLYYLIGGIALAVAAIMGIRSCGGDDKSSGLVVYEAQDLYGYKDADGDIVIPARYETASPFSNGRAKVSVSDSVYYIDERGFIAELIKPKVATTEVKQKINIDTLITPAQKAAAEIAANMVRISGGTFTMGCTSEQGDDCFNDEKPTHQVTLNAFKMNKYEVTQEQWQAIMGNNPSYFKNCPRCPVENVSWNDVQEFIKKLNSITVRSYRLPTEAEWEYAARGGQGYNYSGSNNLGSVAWYRGNSGERTHPVGSKSPNGYGLYDMSGNVWEWCSDWYGSYSNGSKTNPRGPSTGHGRVARGGCLYSNAQVCRVSTRSGTPPWARGNNLGFRLAL